MHKATGVRARIFHGSLIASAAIGAAAGGVAPATAQTTGLRPTATTVSCNPTAVPGRPDVCGVAVIDIGAFSPTPPTGQVALSANTGGTFTPGTSCTLVPVGRSRRTSRCSVTFTPLVSQSTRISASYPGDLTHAASRGHADIRGRTPAVTPDPATVGGSPGSDKEEPLSARADRFEDDAELASAAVAHDRVLKAQILADILADRDGSGRF